MRNYLSVATTIIHQWNEIKEEVRQEIESLVTNFIESNENSSHPKQVYESFTIILPNIIRMGSSFSYSEVTELFVYRMLDNLVKFCCFYRDLESFPKLLKLSNSFCLALSEEIYTNLHNYNEQEREHSLKLADDYTLAAKTLLDYLELYENA